MKIGLQIPDFTTPDGPPRLGADLATVARTADEGGFEFIAVMDHFFQIRGVGPAEREMLEAYTTLGYLAACTSRAKLLTLVTGAVYRHPGVLAKIITTLDVLSGGRAWLGIGAAWNEEESRGLGIPFPPVAERFERLEETLQICLQMWRGDESPYRGRHYQLDRTLNSPQSLTRPHPPIMIGGGGEKKTLRFVAKYADACNLFPSPDLPRKLDVLRAHCEAEGRDYDEITKTCYFLFDVGEKGEKAGEIVDRLGQLAELGFEVAIGGVANVWQVTPLEVIAAEVIPAVASLLWTERAVVSRAVHTLGISIQDGGSHRIVAAGGQTAHDAGDVAHRAVLAQLGLGLDPGDLQLQADDGAQLALDERTRRVVRGPRHDLPGRGQPGGLVLGRQPPDHALDPGRIVVHDQLAVHVGRDVVPGGDDPAVLGLGGVPGRGHVGVRAADDGQRLTVGWLAPLVIVPGHVTVQSAVLAGRRLVRERQHGGQQAVVGQRDQVGRAVLGQKLVDGSVVDREVSRDIHRTSACQVMC